jgi:hypothetical protein
MAGIMDFAVVLGGGKKNRNDEKALFCSVAFFVPKGNDLYDSLFWPSREISSEGIRSGIDAQFVAAQRLNSERHEMKKSGSCIIFTLLLVAMIPGCDQSARMERRNPEDVALGKSYFELLRSGHADQVEDLIDPSVRDSIPDSTLEEVVATIPQEAPSSVKPVEVDSRCHEGSCQEAIVLEYKYRTDRLIFNLALLKENGHTSIMGLHLTNIPDSFVEGNRFTLLNKGPSQYLIFAVGMLIVVFSLYVLVLCISARIGPRKWVWAAFIVVGFTKLAVNWTTGELRFDFPALVLLWVDAVHVEYGPWLISISVPLGAILFLIIYRKTLFSAAAGSPRARSVKS